MYRVLAAKQVGDVAYYTNDLNVFNDIIMYGRIMVSENFEFNPDLHKKLRSVSLTRNLLHPAQRNNRRWRYGVIIDGNKLSNRYRITPYSYSGTNFVKNKKKLSVKELISYDDGTNVLRIKNWPLIPITDAEYEFVKDSILSIDDSYNTQKKLVHQVGGKRRVNGHMIEEKFLYNNPGGDDGIIFGDFENVPDTLQYKLFKDDASNEYEERIWVADGRRFVSIQGCIKGIILPRSELGDFETSSKPLIRNIRDDLDENVGSYDIMFY